MDLLFFALKILRDIQIILSIFLFSNKHIKKALWCQSDLCDMEKKSSRAPARSEPLNIFKLDNVSSIGDFSIDYSIRSINYKLLKCTLFLLYVYNMMMI